MSRAIRGIGEAKSDVIRIKPKVREDLRFLRKLIGLSASAKEGDVIEALCRIYKKNKADNPSFLSNSPLYDKEISAQSLDLTSLQTTLDDYKKLYDNQCLVTQRWKKRFDKVCEDNKIDKNKILSLSF
jgi:hypothetical protein